MFRFEHLVLEAALNIVCSNLNRRVRSLAPAVASTLNGLRAESRGLDLLQQTQVDELLPLKNKLDESQKIMNTLDFSCMFPSQSHTRPKMNIQIQS